MLYWIWGGLLLCLVGAGYGFYRRKQLPAVLREAFMGAVLGAAVGALLQGVERRSAPRPMELPHAAKPRQRPNGSPLEPRRFAPRCGREGGATTVSCEAFFNSTDSAGMRVTMIPSRQWAWDNLGNEYEAKWVALGNSTSAGLRNPTALLLPGINTRLRFVFRKVDPEADTISLLRVRLAYGSHEGIIDLRAIPISDP